MRPVCPCRHQRSLTSLFLVDQYYITIIPADLCICRKQITIGDTPHMPVIITRSNTPAFLVYTSRYQTPLGRIVVEIYLIKYIPLPSGLHISCPTHSPLLPSSFSLWRRIFSTYPVSTSAIQSRLVIYCVVPSWQKKFYCDPEG